MMTGRRSLLSAAVTTHSPAPAQQGGAETIPTELVTDILEYLDQDDLWEAAAVSRSFYAAAWQSGLYIHRNLLISDCSTGVPALTALREVVQHILHHDLRLSFSLSEFCSADSDSENQGGYSSVAPLILQVLSTVKDALPVLVFLSLRVHKYFCPFIDDALRHPAPRLEDVCLTYSRPIHTVPLDVFSGFAPRLRRVTLCDVYLELDPVPAFSGINHIALDYAFVFPDIDFACLFPCVRSIRLAFSASTSGKPTSPRFELHGISLHKLDIEDREGSYIIPAVEQSLKLCDIAVLKHVATCLVWTQSVWQQTDDMLSIRLTQSEALSSEMGIHIVPEHRNWRRTCHLRKWPGTQQCPIVDMPGIGNRLTYLRMDDFCLTCFLKCDGLVLDALRNLQIDLNAEVWLDPLTSTHDYRHIPIDGPDQVIRESSPRVNCPNLENLRLLAVFCDHARIKSRDAAFLGRAMSQTLRPAKERAALAVIDIEFREPVEHALLEQAFSSVAYLEYSEFADYGSPADDTDGGLWDEDIC